MTDLGQLARNFSEEHNYDDCNYDNMSDADEDDKGAEQRRERELN